MSSAESHPTSSDCEKSITRWIIDLREGDQVAAHHLWAILRQRLCSHASKSVVKQADYDEEDVALSAFGALCEGLQAGRYDQIGNRDEMWRLLGVITLNKARKRAKRENALKRGGAMNKLADADAVLQLVISPEPPAEIVISMEEECERLLGTLQQDELKKVVLLKVEGYQNDEIASTLGCTRRSVQRRLALIRDIWTDEIDVGQ